MTVRYLKSYYIVLSIYLEENCWLSICLKVARPFNNTQPSIVLFETTFVVFSKILNKKKKHKNKFTYFKSIEYSKIIPPFFRSMTLESSIFLTKILKAIADIH